MATRCFIADMTEYFILQTFFYILSQFGLIWTFLSPQHVKKTKLEKPSKEYKLGPVRQDLIIDCSLVTCNHPFRAIFSPFYHHTVG